MSQRHIVYSGLAASLFALAASSYYLWIYDCGYSVSCFNATTGVFAVFYSSLALSAIFLLLLLVPRAFGAWKKFAIWYIPLAALIFLIYPQPGSGDFASPYPEQVYRWVSELYVAVSVMVIAYAAWRQRKRG